MRREGLFTEVGENVYGEPEIGLDRELLKKLRKGPLQGDDDLETAIMFTRFLLEDFTTQAQGYPPRLTDQEVEEAQRCLRGILRRHNIDCNIPWRSFEDEERQWKSLEGSGPRTKEQRINRLDQAFLPIIGALHEKQDRQDAAEVALPVSPRGETGWTTVDDAIDSLRETFAAATSAHQYKAVGLQCVTVLERLSESVYDVEKHVTEGEEAFHKGQRKNRMERYISDSLAGKEHKGLRALLKAADTFAESVKHQSTPTRRDAGIAADTVILVAHMLRRINPEDSRQLT